MSNLGTSLKIEKLKKGPKFRNVKRELYVKNIIKLKITIFFTIMVSMFQNVSGRFTLTQEFFPTFVCLHGVSHIRYNGVLSYYYIY